MERGTNNIHSAPKQDNAYCGVIEVVPMSTNVVPQYQITSKFKNEDKASGSYQRHTTKEAVSTGARHVERGSGQLGVKNEASWFSTVKVGNKAGYTEYYTHERVREVDFGTSYKSVKNGDGTSNKSSNQLANDHGGYYYYSDE
ncbi:hypothetical protein LguiA_018856 [Lonicera macranthoides]